MEEWKCPLNEVDNDIRELVEIALNNGMRPYMSCSGSYRDHKDTSTIPVYGFIELLDSEYIREVIAVLSNNKNFSCKIKKAPRANLYGNELPEGLRFEIDFENTKGNVEQELKQVFNDVILGKSLLYDRKKVDSVCELLSTFDVKDGSQIAFYFNAPRIDATNPEKDNYAIEIRGRKNTQGLIDEVNNNVDGIEQDEELCTIYGSDIITMGAVLKKAIMTYPKLSYLGKGEKNRRLTLPNREDFLFKQYNSHINEARIDSDSVNYNIKYFDIDDLLNL